jgi:hypothetical protein
VGLPDHDDYRIAPFNERKLILESDYVSLWYYPELKLVHHRMLATPTSEAFRELLSEGAYLVERFRAPKWLSDDRGNSVLREPDEAWAHQEWLPRVLRGGFRYWAIVPPTAAIGKLNMRRLAADHARYGIVSSVERTPEAAFDWLKKQV